MTPNAAKKGRSFKGAVAYIIHDPDGAKTAERVLFTETRNLRTDDPEKAAKVMAYTAQHAAELKEAAGIKATGRKTDAPVYHLSLSWVPGEKPTQTEMMEAGTAILEKLGYGEHEAVFAAHGDKAHMHLHIIVSRIHPVTGKTHNPKDDQNILQAWGHEYDKARGMEHHSPERAAKYEKDPEKKAEYQRMAEEARQRKGAANGNSKPRADWEAAIGATHPKSRKYQEIKAEYAERVKTLSDEGRSLALRHKEEWAELKTAQRGELKDLANDFRRSHATEIREFMRGLRNERAEFRREEKSRPERLERDAGISAHTPVGQQGAEHRDNLARLFNDQVLKHSRPAALAREQKQKKKEFFERLELGYPLPGREQNGQQNMHSRFREAAGPDGRQPSYRQERAALLAEQKEERAELKEQQQAERAALQQKWAEMNDDRSKAWEAYRERRAAQEKEESRDTERGRTRGDTERVAESGRIDSGRADSGRFEGRNDGGGRERGRDFGG
ncbi:relaxase/mobilization nuclease-like protein [Nitrosospira multiformis]|uniref:Relaxase/mobilization nuclease-like protein n=1 Tax=Nitrosospira multiformis TaxID=1231 RepID=A0A2T5IH32_9PROT|nr:relaxase/mobilization nuclease domain-containing protein [Nitrosospira multiformis]PTQ83147.1 relaxase/mobilization nuclease-like protein [Nitrosospira multiformis]